MNHSILQATFQHIKGISANKEQELWSQGINSWKDLEGWINPQVSMFQESSADNKLALLGLSESAFQNNDTDFFADLLHRREYFRIALTYPQDTLFLDIETTGLSSYYDYITLVGWSIQSEYGVHIKGSPPDELLQALKKAKALVTFNGTIFDIPFLKKEIPDMQFPKAHVDLRFFGKRVGLAGGQKEIEKELKIKRPKELAFIQGEAAPVLWYEYMNGDLEALRKLIAYNHADIEGMKIIFDESAKRMIRNIKPPKNISIPHFKELRSEVRWLDTLNTKPEGRAIAVQPYIGSSKPFITINELATVHNKVNLRVIGIDLVGSEEKESGWCLLNGTYALTKRIASDSDLIKESLLHKPILVSIDSPLSLPKGRTKATDDDPGRDKYGIMRICERILKKRGINVYPALIPSMQKMTARGISLANKFRQLGVPVIESYPGAAQDIMNIPRKGAGEQFLVEGLKRFGVTGEYLLNKVSHDELDAITSAIVGLFFWSGKYEAIGAEEENYLIIPELKGLNRRYENIKVLGIYCDEELASGDVQPHLEGLDISLYYFEDYRNLSGVGKHSARIAKKISRAHRKFIDYLKTICESRKECRIAITGMKYAEDYTFLVEQFGPAYIQLLVNCGTESNTSWKNQIEAIRIDRSNFLPASILDHI